MLAVGGVGAVPKIAVRGAYWFSIALFGGLAAALWALWLVMQWNGRPPQLEALAKVLPMDFEPSIQILPLTVAVIFLLAWLTLNARIRILHPAAMLSWTSGIILVWGLLTTLYLPWVDLAKSYRSVFNAMESELPARFDCITSRKLDESSRAILYYVSDIVTERIETQPDSDCSLLLIDGERRYSEYTPSPAEWRKLWEGHRPGDSKELYRLFEKIPENKR